MKMLYVSSVDLSLNNGPSVNEREFIISISRIMNDDILFVIPKPRLNFYDENFPVKKCIFSKKMTKFTFITHSISQTLKSFKMIKKFNPDFILFRSGALPISQYFISKKAKIPYGIKTIGPGLLNFYKNENNIFKKLIYLINYKMNKNLFLNASYLDSVSSKHIEDINTILCSNLIINIVDNSVNTSRFYIINRNEARKDLNLQRFKFIIGYAGNFPLSRGAFELISISKTLINEFTNIGFVILGGEDTDKMKDLVSELGVSDNFIITGRVPLDSVNKYINTFDIGVSFLKKENMGASEQKIRQYISCGVPVICSSISSEFVAEHNIGFVVKNNNLDIIIDVVKEILNNDYWLNDHARQKIRNYAIENLSVESSTKIRVNLINEVISRKKIK